MSDGVYTGLSVAQKLHCNKHLFVSAPSGPKERAYQRPLPGLESIQPRQTRGGAVTPNIIGGVMWPLACRA